MLPSGPDDPRGPRPAIGQKTPQRLCVKPAKLSLDHVEADICSNNSPLIDAGKAFAQPNSSSPLRPRRILTVSVAPAPQHRKPEDPLLKEETCSGDSQESNPGSRSPLTFNDAHCTFSTATPTFSRYNTLVSLPPPKQPALHNPDAPRIAKTDASPNNKRLEPLMQSFDLQKQDDLPPSPLSPHRLQPRTRSIQPLAPGVSTNLPLSATELSDDLCIGTALTTSPNIEGKEKCKAQRLNKLVALPLKGDTLPIPIQGPCAPRDASRWETVPAPCPVLSFSPGTLPLSSPKHQLSMVVNSQASCSGKGLETKLLEPSVLPTMSSASKPLDVLLPSTPRSRTPSPRLMTVTSTSTLTTTVPRASAFFESSENHVHRRSSLVPLQPVDTHKPQAPELPKTSSEVIDRQEASPRVNQPIIPRQDAHGCRRRTLDPLELIARTHQLTDASTKSGPSASANGGGIVNGHV